MFKKYTEIENSYREKLINYVYSIIDDKNDKFVVTEKIHGMNFSFIVNENEIQIATRNNVVDIKEKKYNKIIEKYEKSIKKLFSILKEKDNEIKTIQIYGEFFGGYFDGKSEGIRVQKGIEYIPFNDFMIFDIRIEKENEEYYLSFSKVLKVISDFNQFSDKNFEKLKTVPVLLTSSFEECLKYSNDFITKIPNLYGLKNKENNICEGVVIRPVDKDIYDVYGKRILLKNKNDKFSEKQKTPKRKKKNNVELSEDNQELINDILEYATENRLNNVISKGIDVDFKNFSIISKAFIDDIFKDFQKDYDLPESLEILLKQEPSILKIVKNEINAIVRNYIKKMI